MSAVMSDVGIVLGDTSRSRVYVQALDHFGLSPSHAFILQSAQKRPGQLDEEAEVPYDAPWGKIDMAKPAHVALEAMGVPCTVLPSGDINDAGVVEELSASPASVLIYSGFGGVLLRSDVLSCGKDFLHVHGGYLPYYKGSTTNYYSYLDEKTCGASAIFMSTVLDSGPILLREKFEVTGSLQEIDHALDSCYRATVLCKTLSHYMEHGEWPRSTPSGEGRVYYIMHPVLRHLAICSSISND